MSHVILVDEQDNPIGEADKLEAHQQGLLHRAFSIFVIRKQGEQWETLLQQRQQNKYHGGGLWTNTCCSHPQPNELTIDAAQRRLQEEMGFTLPLKEIGCFTYRAEFTNGLIEHEVDHVFIGYYDEHKQEITPNKDEVMNYQWLTLAKAHAAFEKNPEQFTPWFAQALNVVKDYVHG